MTLVLPYCNNQVKNLSFEPLESRIMPCVFDGEPLDFESALMGSEWPTLKDIAAEDDYGPSAANDDTTSAKTTSDQTERVCCKRKSDSSNGPSETEENGPTHPKRSCIEAGGDSGSDNDYDQENQPSCDAQLSQSHQDESVGTADDGDDDLYLLPRRRVPQMWNSRQKWKDERKKVLKMSVGKLTEIEDPELWLLRSVLINNTIKRLHQDIRNERQAKIKHRQQKIDFYNNEKYEPVSGLQLQQRLQEEQQLQQQSSFDDSPILGHSPSEERVPKQSPLKPPSDAYDDTSCDEIFGISEDFLRVTIPDRRVSSPIPMNVQDSEASVKDEGDYTKNNSTDVAMEVVNTMVSSTCSQEQRTTDYIACSSAEQHHHHNMSQQRTTAAAATTITTPPPHHSHQHQRPETSSTANSIMSVTTASVNHHPHRHLSGGSQCATEYRTNTTADNDGSSGNNGITAVADSAFPPRVPILDSVVYHSLLASLESS